MLPLIAKVPNLPERGEERRVREGRVSGRQSCIWSASAETDLLS